MSSESVQVFTPYEMEREVHRRTSRHPNPFYLGWESDSSLPEANRVARPYPATRQTLPPSLARYRRKVHVAGAGPMGMLDGIELAILADQLGLDLEIYVYERAAYGGGKGLSPATIGSHAWLHLLGSFYAMSQPDVTLYLQQSTKRLQDLAPKAFSYPPAFTVDLVGDLADFFAPLGVWFEPVKDRVARAFLAQWGMRLPSNATILRISDASIDVRLLAQYLMHTARQLGVTFVHQGIDSLELQGETIHGLRLSNGERVSVVPGDQVVLACGAQIRPLLTAAGIYIDGLQVFGSQLIGAKLGIPALFTAIGSVSIVPHDEHGRGLVNVIGNANRKRLSDEEAQSPRPDPTITWETRRETEDLYGLRLPDDKELLSWVGIKTELTSGERSQAFHARRIPQLSNGWLTIPGKLSATAICATSLSQKLLRHVLEEPLAWHLYELLSTEHITR